MQHLSQKTDDTKTLFQTKIMTTSIFAYLTAMSMGVLFAM